MLAKAVRGLSKHARGFTRQNSVLDVQELRRKSLARYRPQATILYVHALDELLVYAEPEFRHNTLMAALDSVIAWPLCMKPIYAEQKKMTLRSEILPTLRRRTMIRHLIIT